MSHLAAIAPAAAPLVDHAIPPAAAGAALQPAAPLKKQKIHPIQQFTIGGITLNAVVTAVSTIAAAILTKSSEPYSTPLSAALFGTAGIGAFNTLLNGFDTFFLKAWRPQSTLEHTVDQTCVEMAELRQRIRDLERERENFERLERELQTTLQLEHTEGVNLNSVFQEINSKIMAIMIHGEDLRSALDRAEQIKEEWKGIAQRVAHGTTTFDTDLSHLIPAEARAETAIGTLQVLTQATDMDLEQAQRIADKMEDARQGWLQMLKDLYQEVLFFKNDLERKSKLLEDQKRIISNLEQATESLHKTSHETIEPTATALEALVRRYEEARGRFTVALRKLEVLKNIPDTAQIPYIRQAATEAIDALRT